jgi:hypothetical protein
VNARTAKSARRAAASLDRASGAPTRLGELVEVPVEELDRLADASARAELAGLHQLQGGWAWNLPPGTYSACPAWWGRRRYLAEVEAVLASTAGDEARRKLVSIGCCQAVAAALADSADWRTGRNAMPGVDQLVEVTGWCRRSVQYAIDALERLGCARRVAQGRNWLSRTERLQLWARGSQARSFRAVWALTMQPVGAVDNPKPPRFRTCTLPRRVEVSSSSWPFAFGSSSENTSTCDCGRCRTTGLPATPREEAAPPPASTKHRRGRWDDELIQLAIDLQRALPGQLAGERPARLAGSLSRFYRHGWSALGVESEIRQLYQRKQRPLPHTRPDRPFAWLAAVLRQLDPEENPALLEAVGRQTASHDAPCSHGVNAGERIQYKTGLMACPLCRAEHAAAVTRARTRLPDGEPDTT